MHVVQPRRQEVPHLLKAGTDRRTGCSVPVWQLAVTQRRDGPCRCSGSRNLKVLGGADSSSACYSPGMPLGKNPPGMLGVAEPMARLIKPLLRQVYF